MKRALFILALAAVMTIAMTAAAYADHSPTFFVEWSEGSSFTGYVNNFGNAGTGSPHQNYLEGTEKCAVCHSVHRAPVPGVKWDTNPADATAKTYVAGRQYYRSEFASTPFGGADTQMLLMSSVADSCAYCHIDTSIGGEQIYAGKRQYVTEGTGLAGAEWDAGFGHHNGCTGCHAVHGVSNNFGMPAEFGTYGTFQGPIKSKILKVRAKGSGGAWGTAAAYMWQDEVITFGSAGLVEANALYPGWATSAANDAAVPALNVPLFNSATDAINGVNTRPDADPADAQVSAFCTFCHVNYGYASEATNNPDNDRSLFQGPWYADAPNVDGTVGAGWVTANGAGAYGMPFKNHPLKEADRLPFSAAGASATVPSQVAFVDSSTCRTCHDAGVEDVAGVIVESWPHFTPGYFHFAKGAARVGATTLYGPVELGEISAWYSFGDAAGIAAAQTWLEDPVSYEEAITVNDGQCLKCHVNAAGTAGVGLTY